MSVPEDASEKECGPFQVVFEAPFVPATASASNALPVCYLPVDSPVEPLRRLECSNYDTCLNLAAALNWESFTCDGCSGHLNQSLRWRAGQSARKDSIAKAICGAPKGTILKGVSNR